MMNLISKEGNLDFNIFRGSMTLYPLERNRPQFLLRHSIVVRVCGHCSPLCCIVRY